MQLDVDIRKTLRSGKRIFNLDIRFCSVSRRIVLYGPSGSGKSLTLKAIAGLMTPDAGHIRLGESTLFDAQAGINHAPQGRSVADRTAPATRSMNEEAPGSRQVKRTVVVERKVPVPGRPSPSVRSKDRS